jgi:hypothetical protein
MAFTRLYDDPISVMKKLQQSTDQGLYYLNQPGNGERPPFINDPQIILQKWGANLHEDRIKVESELKGIHYKLSRNPPTFHLTTVPLSYPDHTPEITSQPRSTHPVWDARDLQQYREIPLFHNPQENVEMPFHANVSTRILERNKHK